MVGPLSESDISGSGFFVGEKANDSISYGWIKVGTLYR
jgi:hypothetical protein